MNPKVIDIVFRNLMFYYETPTGLHVFVPAFKHRARLRDLWTGAQIPLSQSLVDLEVDGVRLEAPTTLIDPEDRVVSIEWLGQMPAGSLSAPADLMDEANVSDLLCAHVRLGGGDLTAYPLAMFPERAEKDAMFERKLGHPEGHKITDTLVYHLDISAANKVELVVTGPRRKRVTFDVTEGARFEVYNEDDKIGAIGTEEEQREEELATIFGLFGLGSAACDIHGCAGYKGGNPDPNTVAAILKERLS